MTENRELVGAIENGPAYRVAKVSIGAVHDFPITDHQSVAMGSLFSVKFVPSSLAPLYGRKNPLGVTQFVRLKLN
jgi:hypothetical protein